MTLLAVIIVVSAIILALILTLWTKTRIHEIGVFLSVGIRESTIMVIRLKPREILTKMS